MKTAEEYKQMIKELHFQNKDTYIFGYYRCKDNVILYVMLILSTFLCYVIESVKLFPSEEYTRLLYASVGVIGMCLILLIFSLIELLYYKRRINNLFK